MLALLIITFGIFSRVVLHVPNFTPILSLVLFGGMYLKGRQGIWIPLVLMIISDIIIGFHDTLLYTYGSILIISFMGLWLKSHKNWVNVISTSVLASLIFFVLTNYGAFLSLYPYSLAGLQECYLAAIPFYRSTLLSTVAYSLVLYGGYELVLKRSQSTALARLL